MNSPFSKVSPPTVASPVEYLTLVERFREGFGRLPEHQLGEPCQLARASWKLRSGHTVALRKIGRNRLMVVTMCHPDDCVDLFCQLQLT